MNIPTPKLEQQTKQQELHTNANTEIESTMKTTGLLNKQQQQHH